MTQQQKMDWLANATPDELLKQYVSFVNTNQFGKNAEDIKLTRDEIIRRMGAKRVSNFLNVDRAVINHQIELAEMAVAGDEAALETIATNFGYFGGSGTSYWPDLDRAMAKARKIVETRSI